MPRIYTVNFANVSVSAAQDLIQIVGVTAKLIRILRVWWGLTSTTLPAAQSCRVQARTWTGATIGSGGTTGITPVNVDNGDAACSSTTCATNNTTPVSGGTAKIRYENGVYLYSGDDKRFEVPPILTAATHFFTYELLSTLSGTCALSGGAEISEEG